MSVPMALENPDWAPKGLALIEQWAKGGRRFTADDLHAEIGEPYHPNQWGSLLTRARNLDYIVEDGAKKATRGPARGRLTRIWAPNPQWQTTALDRQAA
ncbi:hypothetical protein [Galactobacter valiniphilus]|uniref:hypothetical protein n=1 Tax=Galactobacter valiniphilus TaxID=2676122 RepID=UPI00373530FD